MSPSGSNDAEHDALWSFVEWAERLLTGLSLQELIPPDNNEEW